MDHQQIIDFLKSNNELFMVKFDTINSKYDLYINNLETKIINIIDKEIIDFYEIEVIPTIIFYKNNTIVDKLEGFHPKTKLVSKLLNLLN
tara:strand:- start:450 stop:719 length:270 start_codon:yes stop_codon:yes gene_type:complete